MKGDLKTHSGGVLIFGVHDMWEHNIGGQPHMYCCTYAEYAMGINEIPTLNLIIGNGQALGAEKGDWDTEEASNGSMKALISESINRRREGGKMLRCSLYESSPDGIDRNAIFRGYVVSVTELIKTGDITARGLRVMCMGLAAILQVAPLGGYRRTVGAYLVNAAQGKQQLPTNGMQRAGFVDPFVMMKGVEAKDVCRTYNTELAGKDILTKMAFLANVIVEMNKNESTNSSKSKIVMDDSVLGIKNYLFCDYVLNPEIFPGVKEAEEQSKGNEKPYISSVEQSLNIFLCESLLGRLQQNSILASIVSVANSLDMLMNLIPRFKYGGLADDFRMEMVPAEAWNAVDIITIPNKYVTGCNTSLNNMEHLNDPEILVVDYSNGPGSSDGSQRSGQSTGSFGIYALSEDIREWARNRYAGNVDKTAAVNKFKNDYFKTQFFNAPVWLNFSHLFKPIGAAIAKTRPDDPPDDNQEKGGSGTMYRYNLEQKSEVADLIAQAMFVWLHGASDRATFHLSSDVRFGLNSEVGCLENHIGKTIDVCGYRGILRQVRYTYSSGMATKSHYSIVLERVRLIDPDEPHVDCVFYVKRPSDEQRDSVNNYLWADTYDWSWDFDNIEKSGISPATRLVKSKLNSSTSGVSSLGNVAQKVLSVLHG